MISELKDDENLCAELGAEDVDRDIIAEASYYIPAYRDYLIHRGAYASFATYIETHASDREQTKRVSQYYESLASV